MISKVIPTESIRKKEVKPYQQVCQIHVTCPVFSPNNLNLFCGVKCHLLLTQNLCSFINHVSAFDRVTYENNSKFCKYIANLAE